MRKGQKENGQGREIICEMSNIRLADEAQYANLYGTGESSGDSAPLLGKGPAVSNQSSLLIKNQACVVFALFGVVTLTFVGTYILADPTGRFMKLEKKDEKMDERTGKAIQVYLAALCYGILAMYNYKKYKDRSDGVSEACVGGDSAYARLS